MQRQRGTSRNDRQKKTEDKWPNHGNFVPKKVRIKTGIPYTDVVDTLAAAELCRSRLNGLSNSAATRASSAAMLHFGIRPNQAAAPRARHEESGADPGTLESIASHAARICSRFPCPRIICANAGCCRA